MAEVAWRMAEAREEEHHQAPPRPPSKYTLIHPWGMWTVCECVCVCCGFEASIWRGWRAPSSPRPCRPQHLWAGGGRSPRRRSHRPARCCLKDEKDEFYCERFQTAPTARHVWTEHVWSFPPHAAAVNGSRCFCCHFGPFLKQTVAPDPSALMMRSRLAALTGETVHVRGFILQTWTVSLGVLNFRVLNTDSCSL